MFSKRIHNLPEFQNLFAAVDMLHDSSVIPTESLN